MLLSIGIICAMIGLVFKAFPPRKINFLYGYRTKSAMKNQDTWNMAQNYSASALIMLGFAYIIIGFILNKLVNNLKESHQSAVFLIGIAILIIFVESKLKKIFAKDGSRKSEQ